MNASIRYEIDDTERNRPHVRLCHRILSEALAAGFTVVELATPPGAIPTARAQIDGSWKPLMAFPPAVFSMLVEYLRHMASVAPDQRHADGTILVRAAGRDASVTLSVRRNDQGADDLVLSFPTSPVGQAAV
jgi:hypothetical protein